MSPIDPVSCYRKRLMHARHLPQYTGHALQQELVSRPFHGNTSVMHHYYSLSSGRGLIDGVFVNVQRTEFDIYEDGLRSKRKGICCRANEDGMIISSPALTFKRSAAISRAPVRSASVVLFCRLLSPQVFGDIEP